MFIAVYARALVLFETADAAEKAAEE